MEVAVLDAVAEQEPHSIQPSQQPQSNERLLNLTVSDPRSPSSLAILEQDEQAGVKQHLCADYNVVGVVVVTILVDVMGSKMDSGYK